MPLNVRADKQQRIKRSMRKDPDFAALLEMEPDELDTWLDDNMKSVTAVRRILKGLIKAVIAQQKEYPLK